MSKVNSTADRKYGRGIKHTIVKAKQVIANFDGNQSSVLRSCISGNKKFELLSKLQRKWANCGIAKHHRS